MGHLFYTNILQDHFEISILMNQGGKGEVVGQLSCIYGTITTKIIKKMKKNFI